MVRSQSEYYRSGALFISHPGREANQRYASPCHIYHQKIGTSHLHLLQLCILQKSSHYYTILNQLPCALHHIWICPYHSCSVVSSTQGRVLCNFLAPLISRSIKSRVVGFGIWQAAKVVIRKQLSVCTLQHSAAVLCNNSDRWKRLARTNQHHVYVGSTQLSIKSIRAHSRALIVEALGS